MPEATDSRNNIQESRKDWNQEQKKEYYSKKIKELEEYAKENEIDLNNVFRDEAFYQTPCAISHDPILKRFEKDLYSFIFTSSKNKGLAFQSQRTLADYFDVCIRTVNSAINNLHSMGYIEKITSRDGKAILYYPTPLNELYPFLKEVYFVDIDDKPHSKGESFMYYTKKKNGYICDLEKYHDFLSEEFFCGLKNMDKNEIRVLKKQINASTQEFNNLLKELGITHSDEGGYAKNCVGGTQKIAYGGYAKNCVLLRRINNIKKKKEKERRKESSASLHFKEPNPSDSGECSASLRKNSPSENSTSLAHEKKFPIKDWFSDFGGEPENSENQKSCSDSLQNKKTQELGALFEEEALAQTKEAHEKRIEKKKKKIKIAHKTSQQVLGRDGQDNKNKANSDFAGETEGKTCAPSTRVYKAFREAFKEAYGTEPNSGTIVANRAKIKKAVEYFGEEKITQLAIWLCRVWKNRKGEFPFGDPKPTVNHFTSVSNVERYLNYMDAGQSVSTKGKDSDEKTRSKMKRILANAK